MFILTHAQAKQVIIRESKPVRKAQGGGIEQLITGLTADTKTFRSSLTFRPWARFPVSVNN